MAVLHDAVRAGSRAEIRARTGHLAYAVLPTGGPALWQLAASRAQQLGFDTLLALAGTEQDPAADRIADFAAMARAAHAQGLLAAVAILLDRVDSAHDIAASVAPSSFSLPPLVQSDVADPRHPFQRGRGTVRLRHANDTNLVAWWRVRLDRLRDAGLDGAYALQPGRTGQCLAHKLSSKSWSVQMLAAPGAEIRDGKYPLIGGDAPATLQILAAAAMNAPGWAVLEDAVTGLETTIQATNRLLRDRQGQRDVVSRDWTGQAAQLGITSRAVGSSAVLLVENRGTQPASWPPRYLPPMPWQQFSPIPGFSPGYPAIAPGGIFLLDATALPPAAAQSLHPARQAAESERRVAITRVAPSVDHGNFAVKRVVGSTMQVEADIFADGHEQLAAAVLLRVEGDTAWTRYAMSAQRNDIWTATVSLPRLGRHTMVVQAWLDIWGGFVRDLLRKCEAGQDVTLEIREARAMIEVAKSRAKAPHAVTLADVLLKIDAEAGSDTTAFFTAAPLTAAMAASDNQPFLTGSFQQPIEVEREAAQFSGWYELFPRSQSPEPGRQGTFADTAAILPHIAAMGFDTVYFPPIHPIGERNRKGRNNATEAAPGDVGSPYAIGSREGGHDAIHRDLGTLADFQALLEAARTNGLEVAMDFAIQCAPDHPWLAQHPAWFDWRPDGTIKYAENPPKKYQDIVNVDFYADGAVPELWHALRDVVLFWAAQGVRAFRVDNPHTKPLPFWGWLIAAIKAEFPEAIFLSEAFTRPKPMYQLAKEGFSQSYTYFTWRNEKAELIAYIDELTHSNVREFFRPHFFVNTPDINPVFLQSSGRAGFLIRAALAATLSGLWGIYAGFELCESAALPGREEYLDSEKYQLRQRPRRTPGDIVDEIKALNQLRRTEPALQSHLGTEFHNAWNDNILYYSKSAPGRPDRLLVAVSLDPHHSQDADFEVPLWRLDLPDWQTVDVEDLLNDRRFTWTGKIQHVRLTPEAPYAIWRISEPAGR